MNQFVILRSNRLPYLDMGGSTDNKSIQKVFSTGKRLLHGFTVLLVNVNILSSRYPEHLTIRRLFFKKPYPCPVIFGRIILGQLGLPVPHQRVPVKILSQNSEG